MPDLPVCFCGDPGTWAVDVLRPVWSIDAGEDRWVWEVDGRSLFVVTRCLPHAPLYAVEITRGALTRVQLVPIDTGDQA